MLYSIIPTDVILDTSYYSKKNNFSYIEKGDITFEMIKTPDSCKINRLISTNLNHYLNPAYAPSSKFSNKI